MAGFIKRKDPWGRLVVQRFDPICAKIADDFQIEDGNLLVYKIHDKDSDPQGQRIAFIYESEEEDLPKIVGRIVARAKLHHHTGSLECVYTLKVADDKNYYDIVCAQLAELNPDVVVCVSRDVMRKLTLPKDYASVDPLQLINRLHDIGWQDTIYPTVISLPDNDVLLRTEEGKVAKESATRLGEWVYAIAIALTGRNLYTVDLSNYKYKLIKTLAQFEKMMDALYEAPLVAIDTETDNLNRVVNKIATIQFSFDKDFAWVLPVYHPETPFSPKETAYILSELKSYFERADPALHIYWNAKFDLIQLFRDCKLKWYNHSCWDGPGATYCFNPDTWVMTEQGSMQIKYLVSMENKPKILSFNHKTKQCEYKEIINAFEQPTEEDMYELEYEGGCVQLTGSHTVWSNTRKKYIEIKDLYPGEDILICNEDDIEK